MPLTETGCGRVQVHVAEGDWPQSKGVAILSFQSLREAELWKDSVPEIRQPDWLDGVDMIIAPVRSMPRTYECTHAQTTRQ